MTNTGWILLDGAEGKIELRDNGVFKPSHGSGESTQRLREIRDHFVALVEEYGYINAVAMEGYSRGSMNRREEAGELGGILRVAFLELREADKVGDLYVVAPQTLKKFACGKGNAGKVEVALGAARKWPDIMAPCIATEHEADALILAMVAMLKSLYSWRRPVDWGSVKGVLSYEGKILDGLESEPM